MIWESVTLWSYHISSNSINRSKAEAGMATVTPAISDNVGMQACDL